jgi:thiol-disulfide isomerase/thioredoxin
MKKLIIILLLMCLSAYGSVEFLNNSNFNNKISKGIVVVEYWAEWNNANKFKELKELKDCTVYRACIAKCTDAASKYNIKAIPTVIIYDNGEEIKRFSPNIMLQLEASGKDVQSAIDEIVLNKFQ